MVGTGWRYAVLQSMHISGNSGSEGGWVGK